MNFTIGIIGSGAMGTGIAQVAAQAGHRVLVYDTRNEALLQSQENLQKTFARLVEKGKLSQAQVDVTLANIVFEDNLRAFNECGLVIEAIVERLDAKKSVFKALEAVVPAACILATNTSSLSIAAISGGLEKPERLVGIHFFNPAPLMPLVEIIGGLLTSSEVLERANALIQKWGKTTVLAKDSPGFIVNRIARPFYSEAIKMYEEGLADFATIDWALKSIGGFKMGPFELMDLIGHDVNYLVTETVWTQFYFDPRFKPSITQKRLFEAGLNGRKSGRGFYNYSPNAPALLPIENAKLGKEIVDRVLAMLVNEAADAVFLNIASAPDIDLAMTLGVNYPKGLLAWGNEIGPENILSRLEKLHAFYGDDRYRACPLLRQIVTDKKTFAV